uniref:Uncharacterized protein n=1 Tax=Chenopodium quinoa TaxID=63459 RepID=A0A803L202_CHEQI
MARSKSTKATDVPTKSTAQSKEVPKANTVGDTRTPPASSPFSPLEEGEEQPHTPNWKHVNRRVVEMNAELPLMKERMGSIEESLEATRKMQSEMLRKLDTNSSGEVEDTNSRESSTLTLVGRLKTFVGKLRTYEREGLNPSS